MRAEADRHLKSAARGHLVSRRLLLSTGLPAAGAITLLAACGGSSNKNNGNGNVANSAASAAPSAGAAASPVAGAGTPKSTASAGAPATSPSAGNVVTGGTLFYGGSRDVTTLDPHVGSLSEEVFSYAGMFESSLTYGTDSQLAPSLARSFEYPDNTTIVFHYGSGVQFHDGTPFDATAVKANFDRYLDPATGSPSQASLVKKIAKTEVVDPKTFKITLTQPDATALASVALIKMISPAAITKYGKDLPRNPVGTAAFKFKEWLKDDHLTMARFDGYWNAQRIQPKAPRLDEFTFKPITDPSVMLSNLKTGNIAIAGSVQPVDFVTLNTVANVNPVQRTPSSSSRMYLNLNNAPVSDLRVRQAINLAIDRDALGKAVYFGLGQPARSIFPPTHWMYPKDRPVYKRDVNGAKTLLQQAGLSSGTKLDMILPAAEPYKTIAQVLQASLADAGVQINIRQLESSQFLDALKNHDGHLALDAIANRSDPDGFFSGNFKADAPFNFAGFNDPQFEKALADGLLLTDQEQRRTLYQQAEQRLLDVVPGIFLYNPPGLYATLKTVQEFTVVDFIGGVYDTTWLKKS
jgi:peptide/nickel transport system substrate-binding protein